VKPIGIVALTLGAGLAGAGLTYGIGVALRSTPSAPAATHLATAGPTLSTTSSTSTTSTTQPPTTTSPPTLPPVESTTTFAPLAVPQTVPIPTTTTVPFVCPTGSVTWTILGYTATLDQSPSLSNSWSVEVWGTVTNTASAEIITNIAEVDFSQSPLPNTHDESTTTTVIVAPLDGSTKGLALAPGESRQFDGSSSYVTSTTKPTPTGSIQTFDKWQTEEAISECPPPN
jgi:hypothetical protein